MREYRREHAAEIQAKSRKWRSEHREQIRVYNVAYRQEHQEELKAYAKQYRKEHKEEIRLLMVAYRQKHAEELRLDKKRYAEEHRQETYLREQRYRQSDRGRAVKRAAQERRQALQAGLPATLTETQWEGALSYFGYSCAYCGASDVLFEQEHLVPVSAGGGYVVENILPACKRCNRSKRAATLVDWATGRGAEFVLPQALESIRGYLESVRV